MMGENEEKFNKRITIIHAKYPRNKFWHYLFVAPRGSIQTSLRVKSNHK